MASIPRAMPADCVRRLLDESKTWRTPAGLRNRAILLLLARLGLRAREIVRLELDDIDWSQGWLRVHGKGRQERPLPLPHDVGEAIASYLKDGRPESTCRRVFLRSRAPFDGLRSQQRHLPDRPPRDRPRRDRGEGHRLASTASCACRRHAAPGALADGDRPGAAASQPRGHAAIREGRSGRLARGRPAVAGRAAMTSLREGVSEYLELRRSLGFRLKKDELLPWGLCRLHGTASRHAHHGEAGGAMGAAAGFDRPELSRRTAARGAQLRALPHPERSPHRNPGHGSAAAARDQPSSPISSARRR